MTKAKTGEIDWTLLDQTSNDDEPVAVVVRQRSGEPFLNPDGSPCTVGVLGEYSRAVKAYDDANMTKGIRRGFRAHQLDAAQLHARMKGRCVAAMVEKFWKVSVGGVEAPFSKESAKNLLSVVPWLVADLNNAMSEGKVFSEASSTD